MRRLPVLPRHLVAFVLLGGILTVLAASLLGQGRAEPSVTASPSPTPATFLERGYAELNREAVPPVRGGGSLWDLLSAIVVPTLIVIAAAYGVIRLLRSLNRRVVGSMSTSQFLELIDTLPLAGSGVMHIVRVGDRYLLIGAGTGGLSLLTELQQEEVERLRSRKGVAGLTQAAFPSFRDLLQTRTPRSWLVFERIPEEKVVEASAEPPRFGHVPDQSPMQPRA